MIDKTVVSKIEKLYKLYGFDKAKESAKNIVFTYSNGYFHNAEIIQFEKNNAEMYSLKIEYESIGYSVRNIEYQSFEKMHEELFNGFFAVENINRRLQKEYDEFCKLQSAKLFSAEYEYVEPSCNWNNGGRQYDIVNRILEQLYCAGAQLIILEAAAGYGKTCTSYEIIKKMANTNNGMYAPIFTELSKNRKAALFRYVLLDEIDRKFTSLSSELVISEIQNGKVPLIIDGFDELISQSNKNMTEKDNVDDDDSQTMLDTIAELFTKGCATKVVLTSRKSAIFTGDIFEEWVGTHLLGCTVTRVSIEEPTVQDWIGHDKSNFLQNQKIPFASIVNPILLAFMRSMDIQTFEEKCSNVENVINYYFESLLERERERQALQLSVVEQYEIIEQLAKSFVEFGISAEEFSFIKDLFLEIIHDKFKEYRERYVAVEEKPTEEEFATKLAGHALLNRVSPRKNDIGFINDFIFGILIGDNIIKDNRILKSMSSQHIVIACTAYSGRSEEKKEQLFENIVSEVRRLNYEEQLDIEIKLTNTIKRDYQEHYFAGHTFNSDVYFDGEYRFINCTFKSCSFSECVIMTSAFFECSFYDCKFYNVIIMRDTVHNCGLVFSANCVGHEEFVEQASYEDEIVNEDSFEQIILKKYWGTGARFSKGKLPEIVLLKTQDAEERKGLVEALDTLKKEGLIFKDGHYWYMNKDEIKEIKRILGI